MSETMMIIADGGVLVSTRDGSALGRDAALHHAISEAIDDGLRRLAGELRERWPELQVSYSSSVEG